MGNIWGRKTSNQDSFEAEEDVASGSIEMKGSNLLDSGGASSTSLSSWPLCLPNRVTDRPRGSSAQTQGNDQPSTADVVAVCLARSGRAYMELMLDQIGKDSQSS